MLRFFDVRFDAVTVSLMTSGINIISSVFTMFNIVLMFHSALSQASCLNTNELNATFDLNEYYADVPNFINCNVGESNEIAKFVCSDKEYIKIFDYLSKSYVYAYENANKYEVDHESFNIGKLDFWNDKFKNEPESLCREIKDTLNSNIGDYFF
ncbi:hypothetical protein [Vibrio cholerae]|uniref:hypothetical protein n=1 Tax=Vibrio cholerae TaxID=666 RepID=UPI00163C6BB8|nr:hypothetical protein [Vibrio cholerae]